MNHLVPRTRVQDLLHEAPFVLFIFMRNTLANGANCVHLWGAVPLTARFVVTGIVCGISPTGYRLGIGGGVVTRGRNTYIRPVTRLYPHSYCCK